MAFLVEVFWVPLAIAGLIGVIIGWATCSQAKSSWMSSWLPLGILALIAGGVAAAQYTLPGRYGLWLEAALMMFAIYLAGCCISCFVHGLMFGPPRAAERDPNAALVAKKAAGVNSIADERRERERVAGMLVGSDGDANLLVSHSIAGATAASGLAATAAAGIVSSAAGAGVAAVHAGATAAHSAATAGKAVVGVVPPLLQGPRDGKKDDLTLIWGVAEKLEERMNRMGIWHFDQIAAWTADHIKWFEHEIEGFKGRLERDKWVEQCAKMAKGWRPDNKIGTRPKS